MKWFNIVLDAERVVALTWNGAEDKADDTVFESFESFVGRMWDGSPSG